MPNSYYLWGQVSIQCSVPANSGCLCCLKNDLNTPSILNQLHSKKRQSNSQINNQTDEISQLYFVTDRFTKSVKIRTKVQIMLELNQIASKATKQ